MSDMPENIWANVNRCWSETEHYRTPSGKRAQPSKLKAVRTQYTRTDLTGLQCFYDYEGELPNKLIALYSDGSGCNMFYHSHDNHYGEKMYTSTADNDYIMNVDKQWFADSGYLWFIALPDDFKVWGEDE